MEDQRQNLPEREIQSGSDYNERRLLAIQKSTRVRFNFLIPVNEFLRRKFRWYYNLRIDPLYSFKTEEEALLAIQKSTRTTFRFLQPLHEKIRLKFQWYYRWHVRPISSKVHWATLAVYVAVVSLGVIYGAIGGKHQPIKALLTNGENAMGVIGRYDPDGNPTYTLNTEVGKTGFSAPSFSVVDTTHHRLFVSDYSNNRVLAFNLDSSNNLLDRTADYVLGQSDFLGTTGATSQTALKGPSGLAYDPATSYLYVAEYSNNRVLVFNVASISNGMPATYAIGQPDWSTGTGATSQVKLKAPYELALDTVHHRLFVAEYSNYRVTVFDTTALASGMNASYELGQQDFVTASSTTTAQNRFKSTYGVDYDATNNLLYVSDYGNNRVMVFDVTTITNGMNAVHVLGQTDWITGTGAVSQAKLSNPRGIKVDPATNKLFVVQSAHRVSVFDVASITDGENAVNVLGQSLFNTNNSGLSQGGLNTPNGIGYDAANTRLFVGDATNNRIMIFNVSSVSDGMNASDVLGQLDDSGNPLYTKNGANNTPNSKFLKSPNDVAIDSVHHRMFVSDGSNSRVLVYDLDSSNNLLDDLADYVIGQPDFYTTSTGKTQSKLNYPSAVDYDSTNNRLYVADSSNNRVLVFNVSAISNGMNAEHVLGEPDFVTSTGGVTINRTLAPSDIVADTVHNRLFVADVTNNRVLVFNTTALSDGMDASYVLGQTDFTSSGSGTTQSTFKFNTGYGRDAALDYDSADNKLFVGDLFNNRVMIFDVTNISNGMNASNVIGQTNFTSASYSASQSTLDLGYGSGGGVGLGYDQSRKRLFVSDFYNNRILAFDLNNITDGENAQNVIGQTDYATATSGTSQSKLNAPRRLGYDKVNSRLYVTESGNNRVTVFDTTLTRYWIATSAGNWGDPTNWSDVSGGTGGLSVPGTGDVVVIDGANGAVGNITIAQNIDVKSITIGPNYSGLVDYGEDVYSIRTSGDFSLDGIDDFFTDGDITIGGNFSIASGSVFSLSLNNLSVSGTVSNNGELNTTGVGNISFAHGNDIDSGTVYYNYYFSDPINIANLQYYNLTVSSVGSGSYRSPTADLVINNDFTIVNGTFNTSDGSTVRNITTKNLSIGGTLTANSSTINVSGNLDMPSGTFTQGTSTVNMTGTGHIDAGVCSGTTRFKNINIDASGTITLNTCIVVDGAMELKKGTLAGGQAVIIPDPVGSTAYIKSGGSYGAGANMPTVQFLTSASTLGTARLVPATTYPNLQLIDRGSCATICYYKLAGNITAATLYIESDYADKNVIVDTDSARNYNISTDTFTTIGHTSITNRYGKLQLNSSTLTVGTDLTVRAGSGNNALTTGGATVNVNNFINLDTVTGGSSTFNVAGNWDCEGYFDWGSSMVNFNGSTTQTISASVTAGYAGFASLSHTTNNNVVMNTSVLVAGDFYTNNGTFNQNGYDFENDSSFGLGETGIYQTGAGSMYLTGYLNLLTGGDFQIECDPSNIYSGGNNWAIAGGKVTYKSPAGSYNLQADIDTYNDLVINAPSATFTDYSSSGNINVSTITVANGTLVGLSGINLYISGSLTIGSSGQFDNSAGNLNAVGNNVRANDQTASKQNLGSIVLPGSSYKLSLDSDIKAKSVTVNSNTTFDATGRTVTLTSNGAAFTNSGTATLTNSTVILTGIGNTSTPVQIGTANYYNLSLAPASASVFALTASSAAVANNLVINNNATLTTTTNNYNLTCLNLTINSGGTLTTNASTITVNGTWDSSAVSFNAGTNSKIIIAKAGDIKVKTSSTFYDLEVAHTGYTNTLVGDPYIKHQLILAGDNTGHITVNGWTGQFYFRNTDNPSNMITSNGATATGQMQFYFFAYNSTPLVLPAGNFYNIINFSSANSSGTGYYELGGDITVADNVQIFAGGDNYNAVLDTKGHNITAKYLSIGYNNYPLRTGEIKNTSTTSDTNINLNQAGGAAFIYPSSGTNHNKLNLTGTKTINLTLGSGVNLTNNDTIDATGSNAIIGIAGNFSNGASSTFNPGNLTLNFNRSDNTQTIDSGGKVLGNLTHSGASTLQPINNNLVIDGNFVNSNGTFNANSLDMSVAGNFNLTGGSFAATGKNVTLNGSSLQTVTMGGTGAGHQFSDLTITNNSSQGVSFLDSMRATGRFTDSTGDSHLTFHAGSIYTVYYLTLNGANGHNIVMRSSSPGSYWNFTVIQANPTATYVDVQDSNATGANQIDASVSGFDSGHNLNWLLPAGGVSISGTGGGNGENIGVAVNGVVFWQNATSASNSWTISNLGTLTAGDIISVFADQQPAAQMANAITKYDGSGNITGMTLYDNGLCIGSDDHPVISNTDLSIFDSSKNGNIIYSVSGGNLDVRGATTSTATFYVLPGSTFRPSSASNGNVTLYNLNNAGALTADGNTFTVSGDWLNTGNFESDSSTVIYNANSTGKTINPGDSSFYNIIFDSPSGGWSFTYFTTDVKGSFTVNNSEVAGNGVNLNNQLIFVEGDFILNGGKVTAGSSTIVLSGNWNSSSGDFVYNTSTVEMIGSSKMISTLSSGNSWDSRFYNLTIGTDASVTQNTAAPANGFYVSSSLTVNGIFTINSGKSSGLQATASLTMGTNGTITGTGSFYRVTDNSSTDISTAGTISIANFYYAVLTGSTTARVTGRAYTGNLFIWANIGSATAVLSSDLNVTGSLTIFESYDSSTVTFDNTVNNSSIVCGSMVLGTSGQTARYAIYKPGTATTTVNGNLTIYPSDGVGGNHNKIMTGVPSSWVITGNVDLRDTWLAGTSTISIAGNWSITGGTFTANSSTVIFNGSTAQTITPNGQAFNNLEINNTGTDGTTNDDITISGNLDINGDFTLTNGQLRLNVGSPLVTLAGNVTIGSSGTWTKGSGSVTFDGLTAATFTDNTTTKQNIGSLIINKTDTVDPATNNKVTLGSSMIAGPVSIDGTLGSADTFDLGALGGFTLTIAYSGSSPNVFSVGTNATVLPGNSTVNYTATNASGNINIANIPYNNIQLSASSETYVLIGNQTTAASKAISGSLAIATNATLDVGSNYQITLGGDLVINGFLVSRNGKITMTGSTASVTGSSGSGSFYDLEVNSAGTVTANLDLVVSGTLTVTGTYSIPTTKTTTLTSNGSLVINNSSTIGGLGSFQVVNNASPSFTFNGSGNISVSYLLFSLTTSDSMVVPAKYYKAGQTTFSAGGSETPYTFTLGPGTLDIDGNLEIKATQYFSETPTVVFEDSTNSTDINVGGDWIVTEPHGTARYTAGNETITFDGSGTQHFDSGGDSFNNISHTGSGTLQLVNSGLDVNGIFENTNGTFDANNFNMNFASDWINSGSAIFTRGIGLMVFDGNTTLIDSSANAQSLGDIFCESDGIVNQGSKLIAASVSGPGIFNQGVDHILTLNGVGAPLNVANFNGGSGTSTTIYAGAGSDTNVAVVPYNNLTFDPPSQTSYSLLGNLTGSNKIAGNLTISTHGTLGVNDYDIELAGNYVDNCSALSNGFMAGTGTITFLGANSTISGAAPDSFYHMYDLVINSPGTVTLQVPILTVNNSINVLNGSFLVAAGSKLNAPTTVNIADGATLGGLGLFLAMYNQVINTNSTGVFSVADVTFELSSYGGATLAVIPAINYQGNGNFKISSNGNGGDFTFTFAHGTLTTGKNIVISSDQYMGVQRTIVNNSNNTNLILGGSWTTTGTGTKIYTHGTETVTFNSSSDVTLDPSAGAFYDFVHSGTGKLSITTAMLNIDGKLTLSNGNLAPVAGVDIAIGGGIQLDNSALLTRSDGMLTFDGSGLVVDNRPSKTDLGFVMINNSSTTVTLGSSVKATRIMIPSSGNLNLGTGNVLELTGTGRGMNQPLGIYEDGTFDKGTNSTVLYSGSGSATDIAAVGYNNLIVSPYPIVATTYYLSGDLVGSNALSGDLTIGNSSATLDAGNNYGIEITKNWNNYGTFSPENGVVTFRGTTPSFLIGSTTFYDLIMNASLDGAKQIYFPAGEANKQIVNHAWVLNGAPGKVLTIHSTLEGNPWYFQIPYPMVSGNYLSVKDSWNSSANQNKITPGGNNIVNGDNNRGWDFGLTLTVDSSDLNFGNLIPGDIITGSTQVDVSINYLSGYVLSISDGMPGDNSPLLHQDRSTRIADFSGGIDNPIPWTAGHYGLGFTVYNADGGTKEIKWGAGTSPSDAANNYAGIPQTNTEIHRNESNLITDDKTYIGYKLIVPITQKSGIYKGNVVYSATSLLP